MERSLRLTLNGRKLLLRQSLSLQRAKGRSKLSTTVHARIAKKASEAQHDWNQSIAEAVVKLLKEEALNT